MVGERLTGIGQGTLLAERILGNREVLRTLIAGGKDKKEAILQQVVFELKDDSVGQAGFLRVLFRNIAKEGEHKVTDRRNAAMAILTDTAEGDAVRLTEAIAPLVEANPTVVYDAYMKALQQQTRENDPLSGSIDALLKAGKAIGPHLNLDKQRKKRIMDVWRKILKQPYIKEIKYAMSFDAKVEQLRKQGFTNVQIAERLGKKTERISKSARRLIAAGRIERLRRGPRGSTQERLLRILQEFQATHPIGTINLSEIAKQLKVSRERVRKLYGKLAATYTLPPKTKNLRSGMEQLSPEYLARLDQEVAERTSQGMTTKQIAEASCVPLVWVKTSKKRVVYVDT